MEQLRSILFVCIFFTFFVLTKEKLLIRLCCSRNFTFTWEFSFAFPSPFPYLFTTSVNKTGIYFVSIWNWNFILRLPLISSQEHTNSCQISYFTWFQWFAFDCDHWIEDCSFIYLFHICFLTVVSSDFFFEK